MNAFTSFSSTSFSFAAPAADPFAERYGRALPRDLRAEATGMSWERFEATYGDQHGPVRLGGWSATRLPAGRSHFEATIAIGDTIHTAAATACGPIAGMTAMLHELGLHLEILSFHRHDLDETSITFLLCRSGERTAWVMGTGETGDESSLRAMIAGINRLSA
ncbi:2-isopropylmalate synthase [Rhodococcus sp. Z13]|uniref:2-isopropylmalate synthase n=1 Tax=Rhodococcus sacchari TaxID=2962047 RepID=A0ACD4DKU8_9NOCA|nr:2-isopropylmalate synthase [Rhodococcus sp. Z13]UYP20679.1 2-isopropylmalate synthase [Rhodococcus sp. Z13]